MTLSHREAPNHSSFIISNTKEDCYKTYQDEEKKNHGNNDNTVSRAHTIESSLQISISVIDSSFSLSFQFSSLLSVFRIER